MHFWRENIEFLNDDFWLENSNVEKGRIPKNYFWHENSNLSIFDAKRKKNILNEFWRENSDIWNYRTTLKLIFGAKIITKVE